MIEEDLKMERFKNCVNIRACVYCVLNVYKTQSIMMLSNDVYKMSSHSIQQDGT